MFKDLKIERRKIPIFNGDFFAVVRTTDIELKDYGGVIR